MVITSHDFQEILADIADEFDANYYLKINPDILEAGVDPLEHFIFSGWKEGRNPNEFFDVNYYKKTHQIAEDVNPLIHYVREGIQLGLKTHPYRKKDGASVHYDVRKFTDAGEYFEELDTSIAQGNNPQAKAVAFYLPQFHPIAENNEWWGEGFTEWRNIPRGIPRYEGHYQPRVPRDFGYYELNGTEIMKKQIALAKKIGLHGFCFYYYNFNGNRLLEKPLDAYVADETIDFPFCIIWANENWSRRWDGMENDVLIHQDYKSTDCDQLIDDMASYMLRPNYIRVNGRQMLFIYRADTIPNCKNVIELWRKTFKERHNLEPYILMGQTFGCANPDEYGFDGAIEFPPHKIDITLADITNQLNVYDPKFSGKVKRYEDAVQFSLNDVNSQFPLIKSAFPMWDNDARKQGDGLTFHNSTPKKFEEWVRGLIKYAKQKPFNGEPFVFINAWNEWCEGAYLEPDCHFGHAYGNALSRALHHP